MPSRLFNTMKQVLSYPHPYTLGPCSCTKHAYALLIGEARRAPDIISRADADVGVMTGGDAYMTVVHTPYAFLHVRSIWPLHGTESDAFCAQPARLLERA